MTPLRCTSVITQRLAGSSGFYQVILLIKLLYIIADSEGEFDVILTSLHSFYYGKSLTIVYYQCGM